MTSYTSESGKSSGVTGYEIGNDYILVKFRGNVTYRYTYASAGESAVETMKNCALESEGLATFISQNKPRYSSKF